MKICLYENVYIGPCTQYVRLILYDKRIQSYRIYLQS